MGVPFALTGSAPAGLVNLEVIERHHMPADGQRLANLIALSNFQLASLINALLEAVANCVKRGFSTFVFCSAADIRVCNLIHIVFVH